MSKCPKCGHQLEPSPPGMAVAITINQTIETGGSADEVLEKTKQAVVEALERSAEGPPVTVDVNAVREAGRVLVQATKESIQRTIEEAKAGR